MIPARANLLRDGADVVARHARSVVRHNTTPHFLCVRPAGEVRLFPRSKLPDGEVPNLVGTYTRQTPPEDIAADCAQWLTERIKPA